MKEQTKELAGNAYLIVVNYCNAALTADCIESVKNAGWEISRVVVVDNASPDDSVTLLEQIEGIKLIASTDNGGFAYGNNIGIKYALSKDCSAVILLNNDTVVDENFFSAIFEGGESTVTVPKIYYYYQPNTLWYAAGGVDYRKGRQIHYGDRKEDSDVFSEEKDIEFATGCCMMIPRKVLDSVGLLDEQFFMYSEDMDYSLRLKEAGVSIHYLPKAKVWHKVGMSAGSQSKMGIYYCNRNRFYILKKYKFGVSAWAYTIITRGLRYLCSFITMSNDRVILKAWCDYRKGIMGKVEIE